MPRVPLRATGLLSVAGLVLTTLVTSPAPAGAQAPEGPCRSGRVALTFDDGPAGPTDRLVRILRRADVPATFFMVGQRVAASPARARRVERAGFLVANHSWAHQDMRTQTSAQVTATLRATDRALRRAGTHPMRLMRPPYGALDDAARAGIRAAGMIPVLWTVDSRDWESGTARQVADRILAGLRPNQTNIVLQHDGVVRSPTSVSAVPRVIRVARDRGYCFVALDENGRPGFPTPRASVSVTDAREGRTAVATVRLTKPAGRDTSVRLRTRSLSADVRRDLDRVAGRVVVPAGRLRARVRIPVTSDGIDEHTERFEVVIDRPRGVRIDDASATSRITDTDPPPVVDGTPVTVTEPVGDPTTQVVSFELSHRSAKDVRLVIVGREGTADRTDFQLPRTVVHVRPGTTEVSVEVVLLPDDVEEVEETFTVEVVRARRARTGSPATVTIQPAVTEPPPAPRSTVGSRSLAR